MNYSGSVRMCVCVADIESVFTCFSRVCAAVRGDISLTCMLTRMSPWSSLETSYNSVQATDVLRERLWFNLAIFMVVVGSCVSTRSHFYYGLTEKIILVEFINAGM